MTEQLLVQFPTAGRDADRRLVREYVLDAIDRLAEHPDCEGIGFVRAGQKPGVNGLVLVSITGDPDAVMAAERDRWDELVEAGVADGWSTESVDPTDEWGANGAALRARLDTLAARLSALLYDAFDSPPDPVDAHPNESDARGSPTGVGWWTLLHLLTLQQGYTYRQEIDAYAAGIRAAVHRTADYEGVEAAIDGLDGVIAALDRTRDEVESAAGGR